MTTLGQGLAGLGLVIGFALLCVRPISTATILLATQSAGIAVAAVMLRQPLMAVSPLITIAAIWFASTHFAIAEARAVPVTGGAKLAAGTAAALAALCQSQGGLALPLTMILLSVLLAATRRHPLMDVVALIGMQNGSILAACLLTQAGHAPAVALAVACLVLPLPLAVDALAVIPKSRGGKAPPWLGGPWLCWIDLGIALAVFATTLLIPLGSVASMFAPLLGLDGVMRSWQRRKRLAMTPLARGLRLLNGLFLVLAVVPPNPIVAWLAVFAAITTSVLPTLVRRWDDAVLAFLGAGLALFGLTTPGHFIPSYFGVFAGFIAIAAVVPDLGVVLVVLILRLANEASWPPAAEALGAAIALAALLLCAARLRGKAPRSAMTLLQQSYASLAALSLCLGQADGRFAALVLLILLILSRAAARVTDGPVASLALAGLGGVPPLGVFPGLVLVVLAVIGHGAWLLLPVGAAWISILRASLPSRLPEFSSRTALPSVGWLPLALALLTGYFAPEGLARWWHMLTAGQG
ncbi:MAG TPA: hypothetical protein VGM32_16470 [Rhodopila sp.]|jgi:hypothetical protein